MVELALHRFDRVHHLTDAFKRKVGHRNWDVVISPAASRALISVRSPRLGGQSIRI